MRRLNHSVTIFLQKFRQINFFTKESSYTVNQFDEKFLQWGKISEITTLWCVDNRHFHIVTQTQSGVQNSILSDRVCTQHVRTQQATRLQVETAGLQGNKFLTSSTAKSDSHLTNNLISLFRMFEKKTKIKSDGF